MDNETEYRVEYSIQRRQPGDEDFVEIGFGSSGACSSVNDAGYAIESDLQNYQWETTDGMPNPELIRKESEGE